MTELRVVTTDAAATTLGTITLADDQVTCTGAGAGIFAALHRKMPANSEADVFAYLAQGWSNGPTQLVLAD